MKGKSLGGEYLIVWEDENCSLFVKIFNSPENKI